MIFAEFSNINKITIATILVIVRGIGKKVQI